MRHTKSFLTLIVVVPLSQLAIAQSISGSVNFGTVYGNTNGTACFNNTLGQQYYPSYGSFSFTTAGGNVYVPTNVINPGNNCFSAQFTQGGTDGAITGSASAGYRNTNGGSATVSVSSTGQSYVQTAQAAPKYQVLSILYDPPGDASSSGFTNTSSAGATTSVANNFSAQDSITFNVGVLGSTNGVTFSSGVSSGATNAYQINYQASSGSQLNSVAQAIDHNQDQVYLWLNPSITVRQTGSTTGYYSLGTVDSGGNYNANAAMDVVNVNIAGLKNPASIPTSILGPQTPVAGGPTLPGLASICAHPVACTQTNACGCVTADFAPIVAQDELANDTNQLTAPSSIDSNRYTYLTYITLEGPQQTGSGPVRNSFSLSDATLNSTTFSNGVSTGVGFTRGFTHTGFFTLGITATNTFTYTQTLTAGKSSGVGHTGMATMGSDKSQCYEYVSVYEDTLFHTFAYSLPNAPPAQCN